MNNCTLIVPPSVENLELPDPSLLNFYKDLENRIYWIDDEINEYSLDLIQYIIRWNTEDKEIPVEQRKPIRLLFHSPGGDLTVHSAISDIISLSKTPIIGIAIGEVASAAAYIFLMCHKRYALPSAVFLFHKGSIAASGNANDILTLIEDYQQQLNLLAEKIGQQTSYSIEDIESHLTTDWYIRTEEALKYGVIDGIINDISCFYKNQSN